MNRGDPAWMADVRFDPCGPLASVKIIEGTVGPSIGAEWQRSIRFHSSSFISGSAVGFWGEDTFASRDEAVAAAKKKIQTRAEGLKVELESLRRLYMETK